MLLNLIYQYRNLETMHDSDLTTFSPKLTRACVDRVLLKRADLLVTRGSCYGLVGQNGVGKTTLLTRIAAGDIDNFPTDLNCYYVQHEILDDSGARFLGVVLVRP